MLRFALLALLCLREISSQERLDLETDSSSTCFCTTVPCPVTGENYLTEGGGDVGDYYYVLHGTIPVVSTASIQISQIDLDKGTDTTTCTQNYARSLDDDGVQDCDAGHILANRLGGLGNQPINIFPQNSSVNRGVYAQYEDKIYDCVAGGAIAKLSWKFGYPNSTATKPTSLNMKKYLIKGFSTKLNDAFWLPFTNNRTFQNAPKIIERAEGVYYYLDNNQKIFDGTSGLWCVNAGHGQPKIIKAVQEQVTKLDFVSCFNMAHELPFRFSEKLLELLPNRDFGHVFFTMCGSTAIDTALKIALAYHKSKGNASKTRFIGRERGYHGVGFGGISVGGISANRKAFAGSLLPHVDHMPHTHSLSDMAFTRGHPKWGVHLADELERLVTLHDASTIAAVIVEPVAGSTGVLVPPEGYLRRLREICTKHDILLIFDEVITGFGRVGASFAAERFNVTPDLLACAKGLTNAVVPAGAVLCQRRVHRALMESAEAGGPSSTIELFHGYTYSGHPLAMAAGLATLEVYAEQQLFARSRSLEGYWEDALHSLKGLPGVIDIRNIGLMGAVEFEPIPSHPTHRANDIFDRCFRKGLLVRNTGSIIAFSPPLVSERTHLDFLVSTFAEAVKESYQAF